MDRSKALRNIFIYLIILMMCMFLVGFFSGKKVYASEVDDIYCDVPAPPLESNETYFLYEHNNELILKAYVFDINGTRNDIKVPIYYHPGSDSLRLIEHKIYKWKNNKWIYESTNRAGALYVKYNVRYINFDKLSVPIYYSDTIDGELVLTNKVFFFPESRLSRQLKKVEMKKVLEQVIFLIPTSLGLVVFLIALRKGLQVLKTLLQQG